MDGMTLEINLHVPDGRWTPGLTLINEPQYGLNDLSLEDKEYIIEGFVKFLAERMRDLLKKRIKSQYQYLVWRWPPLSEGYKKFKEKLGLSPNIWEATGVLVNSIISYKWMGKYIVGIAPNKKYPKSKVSVLYVARCMEFGTRYMPARPLFNPTIRFMRRNVRKYWEKYLEEGGWFKL